MKIVLKSTGSHIQGHRKVKVTVRSMSQRGQSWSKVKFTVMAYLHCQTRIRIWTRTRIPNPMAT